MEIQKYFTEVTFELNLEDEYSVFRGNRERIAFVR